MDSNGYRQSDLVYRMECEHPTIGSNPTIAASSNCCEKVFKFTNGKLSSINGQVKLILMLSSADETHYCDGADFKVHLFAKHKTLWPDYEVKYTATLDVRYSCEYLLMQKFFANPTSSAELILWPKTKFANEVKNTKLYFQIQNQNNEDGLDVTHPVPYDTTKPYSYSCWLQYEFVCPVYEESDPNYVDCYAMNKYIYMPNASQESVVETDSILLNADASDPESMISKYPDRTQLRVKPSENHEAKLLLDGKQIQVNAYLFNTDTIDQYKIDYPINPIIPQYIVGEITKVNMILGHVSDASLIEPYWPTDPTLSWKHTIQIDKNCKATFIKLVEKKDDADAQASKTLTPNIIVNAALENRQRKINMMDLANEFDSEECLSSFNKFTMNSDQLGNDINMWKDIFSFTDSGSSTVNSKITLIAEANSHVKDEVSNQKCRLSTLKQITDGVLATQIQYTSSCTFTFEIYAWIGSTNMGKYTSFKYTVRNECFIFNFSAPPSYQLWEFNDGTNPIKPLDSVDLKNNYYEISYNSPAKFFYLPRPVPLLPSVQLTKGYQTTAKECGPFLYSITGDISEVARLSVSTGTGFPVLEIQSNDPKHSGQDPAQEYKKTYSFSLRASFQSLGGSAISYDITKRADQQSLSFWMQDLCLGLYFDSPTVSFNKYDTTGSTTPTTFKVGESDEPINYLLKKPAETFEISRIQAYVFQPEGIPPKLANGRCGNIVFSPKPIAALSSMVTWDESQINPTAPSIENLKFKLEANLDAVIGVHTFSVTIKTDVEGYPQQTLDFKIDVLPQRICTLKFDGQPRTQYKYYQKPYNSEPSDLEEFGDKIPAQAPTASTNCTDLTITFALKGSGGITTCMSLSSDGSMIEISTSCLDKVKPGKCTVTFQIKEDPASITAADTWMMEVTIAETPVDANSKKSSENSNSTQIDDTQSSNSTISDGNSTSTSGDGNGAQNGDNSDSTSGDGALKFTITIPGGNDKTTAPLTVGGIASKFKPPEPNKKKKEEFIPPLVLNIVEMTAFGTLKLSFNRPVSLDFVYIEKIKPKLQAMNKQTKNTKRLLYSLTDEEKKFLFEVMTYAFKVEYKPKDPDMQTTLLNFEIVDFSDYQYLEIRLIFDEPLFVSLNSQDNNKASKDLVFVSLKDTLLFKDPALETPIPKQILLDAQIDVPKQMPLNLAGTMSAAVGATQSLSSGSSAIILVNILGGVGLKQIWKAVNVLQFIVYAKDWKLSPPANLQIFFEQVSFFARGDWIPKEEIMKFLNLEVKNPADYQAVQTRFMIIMVAIVGVFGLLFIGMVFCLSDVALCKSIFDWCESQRKWLIWNGCLRTILQVFLDFSISVCLMYKVKESKPANQITAAVSTLGLIAIPIFVFFFVKEKYDKHEIDEVSCKTKYGTLWEGTDTRNFAAVQYSTVFLVRRLVFAVVSVNIGPWDGGLVIITVCYINLAQQVLYLLVVKPNAEPKEQILEVICEILLTYFFYGLMIAEAWPQPLTKFRIGWFSVGSIGLLFVIMLGNILIDSVKKNYLWLKSLYLQKCKKKRVPAEAAKKMPAKKQVAPRKRKQQQRTTDRKLFVIKEEIEDEDENDKKKADEENKKYDQDKIEEEDNKEDLEEMKVDKTVRKHDRSDLSDPASNENTPESLNSPAPLMKSSKYLTKPREVNLLADYIPTPKRQANQKILLLYRDIQLLHEQNIKAEEEARQKKDEQRPQLIESDEYYKRPDDSKFKAAHRKFEEASQRIKERRKLEEERTKAQFGYFS